MKKMLVTLLVVIMLIPCLGCKKKDDSISVVQKTTTETEINLSTVKTVGNHSYIPLNLSGYSNGFADLILNVINKFEIMHPDWKITDWKFQTGQSTNGLYDYTYGIWVDHEPRTKP
jgi:hypothetical protein